LRIPSVVVLVLLAQMAWKGEEKLPLPSAVVEATVDSLALEYYARKFDFYPETATLRGIPGRDGMLSTYSGRNIFKLLTVMRNARGQLTRFDEDSLGISKWGEYKAILADMASQRYLLEDLETWAGRPTLYVDACADGIGSLYLSGIAGVSAQSLSPRLRMVPQVVNFAHTNLTNPGRLDCRAASERLEALTAFLREISDRPAAPQVDRDLALKSIETLEDFAVFVDSLSTVAPRSVTMSYDDFVMLMDMRNMISDTPEDMRAYASRILDQTDNEIKAYAPPDSLGARSDTAPITAESLRAEAESALAFIGRRDLVGLPAGEVLRLKFFEMPEEARLLYRNMLYLESGAGEEAGHEAVLFFVPGSAEPGMTADGIIAAEAVPGRHMQALFADLSPYPVRRLQADIFTANGWSLYAQDLMAGEGFGGDGAALAALERKRFYAAGTIAAVSMLLGEFTIDQAADFMVTETGIPRDRALALALQYALEPEQPMSYIIGEKYISLMRDDMKRIQGDSFSLKSFHDSFLACGRLPLFVVRTIVLSGS
jgi:hypothetical protein